VSGGRGASSAGAIVVAGPPASGKTTLATGLAAALGWMIADLDAVTGALTRAALQLAGADETAIDGDLGEQIRAARYDALLTVATANLEIGRGVVLAGPFTAELADSRRWRALARRLHAPGVAGDVILVYVDCPADLRWERLRARDAVRDRAKPAHPPAEPRLAPGLAPVVVDAARPLAEQVDSVLAAIAAIAAIAAPLAAGPQAHRC
jgi:predicted kinase